MIKAFFNVIINLLASLIQIICWPINQLISATLPDLSSQITSVTGVLNSIFDVLTWPLGLLPDSVVTALLFILAIEIAKHTIFVSTHTLIKVWNVMQKIKFW